MTVPGAEIARLTDMAFRAAAQEMRQMTAEEARLRQAADDLDRQARRAVAEAARTPGMAGTGADQLWRSWLLARRRDLMIDLAALLARKDDLRRRLTRDGGRAQAAAALAETEALAERKARGRRETAALEAQIILSALRRPPR